MVRFKINTIGHFSGAMRTATKILILLEAIRSVLKFFQIRVLPYAECGFYAAVLAFIHQLLAHSGV